MNANGKSTPAMDPKILLSTLWVFVTVNYIYCDVITDMQPDILKSLLGGHVAGVAVTPGFLLSAAILMEIPMAMIVLARILSTGAGRWANMIAGLIMAIVQVSSLFIGSGPALHYMFFSVIEIGCDLFIVWYAWKWLKPAALARTMSSGQADQSNVAR